MNNYNFWNIIEKSLKFIYFHYYRIIVDLQRCSSPEKSGDYQKAYTEWCNEFQKYRSALQTWEEKQTSCLNSNSLQSTTAFQSNNPFF